MLRQRFDMNGWGPPVISVVIVVVVVVVVVFGVFVIVFVAENV